MQLRKRINTWLAKTLVIFMGAMVLNVLWQVFSRFVLASPSSFTDELARYLMIWVGILGAAYVAGQNQHVAIDVLPRQLSALSQRIFASAVRVFIILFCSTAMVIGGGRLVYISHILGQKSPALQLPLAVVYLVIPISGLLIIYFKVSDLLHKPSS